jgi:peptide/nickel transport system permease protein
VRKFKGINTKMTWSLGIGFALAAVYLLLAGIGATLDLETGLNLKARLQPPSSSHLLGLDENGQDLLKQLLLSASLSVSLSVIVVALSAAVGIVMGLWAGLAQQRVDNVVMRAIEVLQAFPTFLFALGLLAAIGPSYWNLVLAMTITTWTGFARLVRGETLHLKSREFVEASKGFGSSRRHRALHHVLPQLYGLILIHSSYSVAGVVIAEAGLSFLGLGLPAQSPSWGQLLNRGRPYLAEAPHICLATGLLLSGYILCFYLLGDGLRQRLQAKAS